MALTQLQAPLVEPITLPEVKSQAKITHSRDDVFLQTVIIPGVRERGELHTHRQFITAPFRLDLDAWGCDGAIEIPRPPLVSVTSISYVDTAGVVQTLDPSLYQVDAPAGPRATRGRIAPAYGQSWPAVRSQMNAISITFVAGYGAASTAVPAQLRKAMLLDAGSAYAHREDVITGTIVATMPEKAANVYRSYRCRPTQRRVA